MVYTGTRVRIKEGDLDLPLVEIPHRLTPEELKEAAEGIKKIEPPERPRKNLPANTPRLSL